MPKLMTLSEIAKDARDFIQEASDNPRLLTLEQDDYLEILQLTQSIAMVNMNEVKKPQQTLAQGSGTD